MSGLVPVYERRPTPLHAARAGVGAAFCAGIALVAALYEHPGVLAGALAGAFAAAAAAGVLDAMRRMAKLALPFAFLIVAINPIVSQPGQTLLIRGPHALGRRFDVTLEALGFGAVAALRVLVLLAAFALLSAVVDPDGLLRVFRRVSYRSALTASLATRLVPVLARDATRMNEAARCRAEPAGRVEVAGAALRGALDRSVELAAALEIRGYAGASRPTRVRTAWSRHDRRVLAAFLALAAMVIAAKAAGIGEFHPYPRFEVEWSAAEATLAALLVVLPLAPFAGVRARLGVARA